MDIDQQGYSPPDFLLAKQFAAAGPVDIIPKDIVSRAVRGNPQHSGILTSGLLRQRFIHHGRATKDKTLLD